MKRNGNAERQRRKNRGAEGDGVWGGELCSLPRKKFDFGSQYDEFWCILYVIFLQFSYLFYTQNWSSTAIGV